MQRNDSSREANLRRCDRSPKAGASTELRERLQQDATLGKKLELLSAIFGRTDERILRNNVGDFSKHRISKEFNFR
jgi:hypothetical protein